MGKRKERRLAAMGAAGRRVKLDLFAEPSGDFGDSSTKEEVGGDGNSENLAGSPNSPSSSGERPENPLLLLGQYSDEELEEELDKEINAAAGKNSPAEADAKVKVVGSEDSVADKDGDLATQQLEQEKMEVSPSLSGLHKLEEKDFREHNAVDNRDVHTEEKDTVEKMSVHGISNLRTTGDASSGWKMVLHEESNSYYYWNIVTGETSWEVPSVLVQQTEDPKSAPEAEVHDPPVGTCVSNATLDAERDGSLAAQPNDGITNAPIYETREISNSGLESDVQNDQHTDSMMHLENDGDYVNVGHARMTSDASYGVALSEEFASSRPSGDRILSNGDVHYIGSAIRDTRDHEFQGTVGDLFSDSSRLLHLAEYLLERLQSLKRSGRFSEQISKFIQELDIRLKDMKSLVPYGSSLLPFWLHSENQLKQIEAAINSIVFKGSESAKTGETARNLQESTCEASTDEKNATCASSDSDSSDNSNIKGVEEDLSNIHAVQPDNVASVKHTSSYDDSAAGGTIEAHENAAAVGTQKADFPYEEDEDMDVEMEVEEVVPVSSEPVGDVSGVQNDYQPDRFAQLNPERHNDPIELEEGEVAPPPDEEWIPPPPPDDEPIPPPPPDEPPEYSFPQPQSEIQTVQPYSYAEQYGFTYPGSNFEYYGGQANTEVSSNGYYVDANGCQVAAPVPALYYATVTNPYPDATSVGNSVDPVAYYNLQGGSVPVASVVCNVETSGSHSLSTHGSIASLQTGLAEAPNEVGFTSISSSLESASVEVPSVPVSAHPLTTTTSRTSPSGLQGVSVVSAPAVVAKAAMAESVPAVQPKVSRSKKRTVAAVSTLRSNKKVSGLVDKWKAVKEELHEDEEDEPESAYEILEKKRQREIEQWHAQQIASGEARDNANFQPLGGDWRERVKRKRAKRMKEGEENLQEGQNDSNQQPDLDELSKQLPSGWQAYWDESSKQVYYGNMTTAETTWIKPTS